MQESKISKVANAISMLSDKNIDIMEKYAKKLEKDLKYQYLKKVEVIENNDINLNNFLISQYYYCDIIIILI
ncbi:hypothetical protein OLR83_00650 [Campylobacter jejuni]|nr:hypothetical protein [Campylobacter jejuni]